MAWTYTPPNYIIFCQYSHPGITPKFIEAVPEIHGHILIKSITWKIS